MPADLVAGGPLSLALSAFIGIYWGARVGIQFAYFDHSDVPTGFIFVVAEWLLVGLFIILTIVYGYVAWMNIGGAR